MATLPSINAERESVDKVLHGIARPERVKPPVVEFREDHTGDDAVFITFPVSVSTRSPITPKRSKELFDFVQRVEEQLYDLQLGRIPYVRLSETR